jgi:hypothetical protein
MRDASFFTASVILLFFFVGGCDARKLQAEPQRHADKHSFRQCFGQLI